MGLFLLGLNLLDLAETVWNVVLVVVGLGMLIFVHELGHFLVAKLCGVKVEKFYLGFDIGGLKLARLVRGETEYGIGILPLGGYVKMLGQEDNPAKLREEIERARQAGGSPAALAPARSQGSSAEAEQAAAHLAEAERALFDSRSYLAQSVPKRMAIISAGVVMNVLFALLTGVMAYRLGVFQNACGVGAVAPGEAAWHEGLKPGDQIVAIGDKPASRFVDLQHRISLGDIEQGVSLTVRRPGVADPFTVRLFPDRLGLAPTIGIASPLVPRLDERLPADPGSVAASAVPALAGGDTVVQIEGTPVPTFYELHRQLALHVDRPLELVLQRRPKKEKAGAAAEEFLRLSVKLPPQPALSLGLVMGMGPVVAVQKESPAARAGVLPGDVLVAIDGQGPGDPLTLGQRLGRRAAAQPRVELTVRRGTEEKRLEATLRVADWYETPFREKSPMSAPALGVAFEVTRRIEAVVPGSPAEAAGLRPGGVVIGAELLPPSADELRAMGYGDRLKFLNLQRAEIDFEKHKVSWPFFAAYLLQSSLPETRVKLTLANGQTAELRPVPAQDWFLPERGLRFQAMGTVVQAANWAEAFRLGGRETVDALLMVVRFLQKLGSQQVSFRAMGGPVTIAQAAYHSATKGLADLLIFLTLIGANLAVLNILPIPVLDGGHLVFLTYEAIARRPPNERVQTVLTWLGLLFILGLVIVVLGLDFRLISRQ